MDKLHKVKADLIKGFSLKKKLVASDDNFLAFIDILLSLIKKKLNDSISLVVFIILYLLIYSAN
jgi:hypothetical protein